MAVSRGDFDEVVSLLIDGTCRSDVEVLALPTFLARFKRFTTTQIAWKEGLHGRLWQRDYYDHIARDPADVQAQCRYVLNNPVRKGLVDEWTDYPWARMLEPCGP